MGLTWKLSFHCVIVCSWRCMRDVYCNLLMHYSGSCSLPSLQPHRATANTSNARPHFFSFWPELMLHTEYTIPHSTVTLYQRRSRLPPASARFILCEWNGVIYYPLGIYFEISLKARCENCFHFHAPAWSDGVCVKCGKRSSQAWHWRCGCYLDNGHTPPCFSRHRFTFCFMVLPPVAQTQTKKNPTSRVVFLLWTLCARFIQ